MADFNPSQTISADLGIFGIPMTEEESKIILLPVPWEVTTSYGVGASLGPQIIRDASEQIDLFDLETGNAYQIGFHMLPISEDWLKKNKIMKAKAQEVIKALSYLEKSNRIEKLQKEINQACDDMTDFVYEQSKTILEKNKILGVVGGDHSTPLGAIRALSEKYKGNFGILHIDAHADLRCAYQGFKQSHASIMYNVMTSDFRPQKLVQVGIRDFCEEEFDFIKHHPQNILTFFDLQNKKRMLQGTLWSQIAQEIISALPENIYISFDIDGLEPQLCPHTGTPVIGGLSIEQAFYLLSLISEQKKKIIGFDLNEVSPGAKESSEWDGNVGARLLYKLCSWTAVTNKL